MTRGRLCVCLPSILTTLNEDGPFPISTAHATVFLDLAGQMTESVTHDSSTGVTEETVVTGSVVIVFIWVFHEDLSALLEPFPVGYILFLERFDTSFALFPKQALSWSTTSLRVLTATSDETMMTVQWSAV